MKTKTILNTSGALATLGGVAVGSYYALNSKSNKPSLNSSKKQENPKSKERRPISELLKNKSNKPMLAFNSLEKDVFWGNKWKKFKEWYAINENNNDWKIFDWNTKKDSGDAYKDLKELCETNSKKETDEEEPKLVDEIIMHCIEE